MPPPLRPALRHVRSLEDLPGLAAALGARSAWQELAAADWLDGWRPPEGISRAALVALQGGLPWFAVETPAGDVPAAESLAARLVRRLRDRGRPAAVLVLAPGLRRLAAGAACDRAPVVALDLDDPEPLALARLERARAAAAAPMTGGGVLAHAAALAAALDGEGVGQRFFERFRRTLERMSEGLEGGRLGAAERREVALLQLTRVLFLYFVQSKGWLAGDPGFLARQVDAGLARRRRLHRDLFRPLFFGTLNRPPSERGRGAGAFGAVPFLNGGLFEPHPLEHRWRGDVPNACWREAFDDLFEHFHFTVDERAGGPAIAPDMLGRVFEGLMAADRRRATGTFYTPAAVVHGLVDAGLAALVASRLDCGADEAERRLAAPDPAVRRFLAGAAVLDPAVGSGAFLLGVLDRLAARLATRGSGGAALKRRILQRNLFGVDLDAMAVRLTELRLWLAVVADDDTTDPRLVAPLPNLDCLVRQGDSLADGPAHLAGLRRPDPAAAAAVGELRRAVIVASGAGKRGLLRRLRSAEQAFARSALESTEARLRESVATRLAEGRAPTLFGERRGLGAAQRRAVAEDRRRLHRVRAARRRLARTGELPWFAYDVHFADVMAEGGFDLVVGNPPWVRAEALAPDLRARLAERFRWWRGVASGGAGGGFAHRPDLAVAFLERAWELARPGGAVALLLPAKLATAGYGTHARHALAAGGTLHVAADLTDDPSARFDATVYPLALVASRRPAEDDHRVRTSLAPRAPGADASAGPLQRTLRAGAGAPWILAADPVADALGELRAAHPALGELVPCRLGVKTGADDVFVDPPDDVEGEVVRWALRGRDVDGFRVRPRVRLLWGHGPDGRPLPALPPRARAHVARHRERLARRTDSRGAGAGAPPWTLFRTAAGCAPWRVVWADCARRLAAAALVAGEETALVPLNTCYVATPASAPAAQALSAWLNCAWIRAAARASASPAASGFARFGVRVVAALPLPLAALGDADLAALARAGARGRPVQDALDEHAAHLLGLSAEARRALLALDRHGAGDRR